jgi:hypothetical protein
VIFPFSAADRGVTGHRSVCLQGYSHRLSPLLLLVLVLPAACCLLPAGIRPVIQDLVSRIKATASAHGSAPPSLHPKTRMWTLGKDKGKGRATAMSFEDPPPRRTLRTRDSEGTGGPDGVVLPLQYVSDGPYDV